MTETDRGCPDPATLEDHARHGLSDEEGTRLDNHLTGCRTCRDRYFEFAGPSLVHGIPNCHAVKEIGRGRFGVVYKVWELTDSPRVLALKVLYCATDMEKSRFEREIAVLKRINSPRIVKCLESGTAGDMPYYTMELIQGEHLDTYLASRPPGLTERLSVFQRVCRAVADAHAEGVAHRDLKPRNILIDRNGEPHILDFGICSVAPTEWSSCDPHTLTNTGDVIGTLKYMSPEQAWGGGVASPADHRSDTWALGIMLHEIVTDGGYPYSQEPTGDKLAHEALLDRIRRELPNRPRLGNVPRGRDLEVLLERTLAWEPDRRIQSAAELADDLERYCNGGRIKTRPLGVWHHVKRVAVGAAMRSRWVFSASIIAAVIIILWTTAHVFSAGWYRSSGNLWNHHGAAPSIVDTARARDKMLIVGVFDETIESVLRFAEEHGLDGVTAHVPTWRAVHGHLLKRLVETRPQAVVWDYYFASPRPADAGLAAGIVALEDAGVPVIVAAYDYDEQNKPKLSPAIVEALGPRLRHGTIDARDMVKRPGEFIIAAKRVSGEITPSVALVTFAAVQYPQARLDVDWPESEDDMWIDVLYELQPGAFARQRDRVKLTKRFHPRAKAAHAPENELASSAFLLEKPSEWQRRTIPYHTVLTCSKEELRRLTADKLIVVGDFRTTRTSFIVDRHRVKYGTTIIDDVPGCYLLADAIANLLGRASMGSVSPLATGTFLAIVLLAAFGCWLPIRLVTHPILGSTKNRRAVMVLLAVLSGAGLAIMVLAKDFASVHAGMAIFSVLASMEGAFAVEFARTRHYNLDRSRRCLEDFTLAEDRTVTVAPRRS